MENKTMLNDHNKTSKSTTKQDDVKCTQQYKTMFNVNNKRKKRKQRIEVESTW